MENNHELGEAAQPAVSKKSEPAKQALVPVQEILAKSFGLWRKNIDKILWIYWEAVKPIGVCLAVLLLLVVLRSLFSQSLLGFGLSILTAIAAIIFFVATVYYSIRATMTLIVFVKDGFSGEVKSVFAGSKEKFWPFAWLSVLKSLIVFLWCLLLVIPGLIYSIFYAFNVFTFFVEDKRGMAALRSSRELVRGYFWPVALRLGAMLAILLLFMMVSNLPLANQPSDSLFYLVWSSLSSLAAYLIAPWAVIFLHQIYVDLVRIKK